MKRKLINKTWQSQRNVTPDMFCLKNSQNEAYINHLRNTHNLPMSELIDACKLMVLWIPNLREIEKNL